ncbi:hypothetical protein M378DRAFT_28790 [Amanita muscaria Koide BX008]|uniref:NADH:flavin oxidoreductase/NADH oxidase N-terminal domain-containing protein n=1 Tax=Amanita muscaria (strain Koide BX008) TaxID=946122 RepID=A0A0C2SJV2_AMAMK|nr:hypothetical protein M378DRAFT_28791 [Amanita muscaria Koide BX008]KIL54214.1 hypothetical protein M378DRAFT_28790 [Amanita muscaria Koide BX008]
MLGAAIYTTRAEVALDIFGTFPNHYIPREILGSRHAIIVLSPEQFKEAAVNSKAAGFDGVELDDANGYLVAQFLDNSLITRQTNGHLDTVDLGTELINAWVGGGSIGANKVIGLLQDVGGFA